MRYTYTYILHNHREPLLSRAIGTIQAVLISFRFRGHFHALPIFRSIYCITVRERNRHSSDSALEMDSFARSLGLLPFDLKEKIK